MKPIVLLSLFLITGCATVYQTTPIELCEQTVRDYSVLRDNGPAEQYADLFTLDGEFHLGPNMTRGRDALIERHIAANSNTLWRHNMTDIRINEDLTGTTRFHIFTGPKGDKPAAPVAFTREILGDYIDEFSLESGMCKISSRKVKIVFDALN
jgi:hypothetical protein